MAIEPLIKLRSNKEALREARELLRIMEEDMEIACQCPVCGDWGGHKKDCRLGKFIPIETDD